MIMIYIKDQCTRNNHDISPALKERFLLINCSKLDSGAKEWPSGSKNRETGPHVYENLLSNTLNELRNVRLLSEGKMAISIHTQKFIPGGLITQMQKAKQFKRRRRISL